jgi:hypothetical protein
VCRDTRAGRDEYARRRYNAWSDQGQCCAICRLPVIFERTVTDHIEPRGMGGARRDDRQENIQATHPLCNMEKGSKRG